MKLIHARNKFCNLSRKYPEPSYRGLWYFSSMTGMCPYLQPPVAVPVYWMDNKKCRIWARHLHTPLPTYALPTALVHFQTPPKNPTHFLSHKKVNIGIDLNISLNTHNLEHNEKPMIVYSRYLNKELKSNQIYPHWLVFSNNTMQWELSLMLLL